MKRKIITSVLTVFISLALLAQSNDEKVKKLLGKAYESYGYGFYRIALEQLQEAEDLKGAPDVYIQNLKMACLYEAKDYKKAREAAELLSTLEPKDVSKEKLPAFRAEIREVIKNVHKAIEENKGFYKVSDFVGELALAQRSKDDHWGIIDKNGYWVNLPIFYNAAFPGLNAPSERLFRVNLSQDEHDLSVKGLWGYIDANTGKWVIEPKYSDCSDFSDGAALAKDTETDKWGLINKKGEWIHKPVFDQVQFDAYAKGQFKVYGGKSYDKGWGLIRSDGSYIVNPYLESYDNCRFEFNGVIPVKKDGKWGYIEPRSVNKWIEKPLYENCINVKGGYTFMKKDGKYKLSVLKDVSGMKIFTDITDYIFDKLFVAYTGGFFRNGIGKAQLNGKWVSVNTKGEVVPEPNEEYYRKLFGREGMYKKKQNDLYGFVDAKTGNWVIQPAYKEASNFSNGLAYVKLENGKFGFINKTGELVIF